MKILLHTNCDGGPSNWGSFDDDVTTEELTELFEDYYDEDKAQWVAEELIASGEVDTSDGDGSHYTLMEV